MAGVDVGGGGKGKRKTVDSEVNMIPMIDLLMVTISFLLITAVWTHMARMNADAQTPGPKDAPTEEVQQEKQLHVEVKDDVFKLIWKTGGAAEGAIDVPRNNCDPSSQNTACYQCDENKVASGTEQPCLSAVIFEEWNANHQHSQANDLKKDQAILHTDDKLPYMYIVAVIDAIYRTTRKVDIGDKRGVDTPAFNVTFSPQAVSN